MGKKTSEKLLKCADNILSSLEMFRNFEGNSYILAKINKLCSDNMADLEKIQIVLRTKNNLNYWASLKSL